MAIIHIAMFDAENAITKRYVSYSGIPPVKGNVSLDRAIAHAAHDINARDLPLVALDNRLQHTVPSVGAGTKRTSFQVTELVEHEERMIAGAGIVTVPDAVPCSP